MRFPLIVSASPSTIVGPKVLLRAGDWKVVSDHVDSKLVVTVNGIDHKITDRISVTEPTPVWVNVVSPGREKELNVFLESV